MLTVASGRYRVRDLLCANYFRMQGLRDGWLATGADTAATRTELRILNSSACPQLTEGLLNKLVRLDVEIMPR